MQYQNDFMLHQNARADILINNKTEWNLVRFLIVRVDNGFLFKVTGTIIIRIRAMTKRHIQCSVNINEFVAYQK